MATNLIPVKCRERNPPERDLGRLVVLCPRAAQLQLRLFSITAAAVVMLLRKRQWFALFWAGDTGSFCFSSWYLHPLLWNSLGKRKTKIALSEGEDANACSAFRDGLLSVKRAPPVREAWRQFRSLPWPQKEHWKGWESEHTALCQERPEGWSVLGKPKRQWAGWADPTAGTRHAPHSQAYGRKWLWSSLLQTKDTIIVWGTRTVRWRSIQQPKEGCPAMGAHPVPPLSCSFRLPLGGRLAGAAFSVTLNKALCLGVSFSIFKRGRVIFL